MSISIRREREQSKSESDWRKKYINDIYESCKTQVAEIIPHYNSNRIELNGEFLGYDFSKVFDNPESKGKVHLTIILSVEKYLKIQLTAEGRYKEKGDRPTDNFVKILFSIEQDVNKKYYEPQLSEMDIRDESKKHAEEIRALNILP